jgi:hypothetical protein
MTSTQPVSKGPRFGARKPRLNHVAMSLPADLLDEEHRRLIADFYQDVSASWSSDAHRGPPPLVLQVHNIEQFLFLIAEDADVVPAARPLGHLRRRGVRARRHPRPPRRGRRDDRVDIVDKKTDDHGQLRDHQHLWRLLR